MWLSWWRLDESVPYETVAYLEARSRRPNGELGPKLDLYRYFQ